MDSALRCEPLRSPNLSSLHIREENSFALQVRSLHAKLVRFVEDLVIPAEATFEEHAVGPNRWTVHPLMEDLKDKVSSWGFKRKGSQG